MLDPAAAPPDASVVIATRNRLSDLVTCLGALDGQTDCGQLEIVVVDDQSSPPLASEHLSSRWPLRVLLGPGTGPAAARNVGWRAARADHILITDDDVVPDAGWACAARSWLLEHPDDVGVEGPIRSPPYDPLHEYSIEAQGGGFYWTCNVAYRRRTLTALGGFDAASFPRFREDRDLAFRALRLGAIGYAPAMSVVHTPRVVGWRWFYEANRAASADRILAERYPEHFPWGNRIPLRAQPVVSAVKHAVQIFSAERRRPDTTACRGVRAALLGAVTVTGALVAVAPRPGAGSR